MRRLRFVPLVAALAVLAGLAVGAAVPASAEAAKPCWRQLLNDWYDGRIDRAYPIRCYREAIRNLPADVKTYSSAQEDLERALQAAIRRNGGQAPGVVPPSNEGRSLPPEDEQGGGGASGGGGPNDPEGGTSSPEDERGVLGVIQPENADSIPVPLLVLAGVALLLLAAAGAGFVARRIQERRLPVAPVAGPDDGVPPIGPPK
jgi:hypothetical protein